MTEFIYAYKELPEDLEANGVAVSDWLDLPEINRILNGQFRFYGNYKRDGEFVSYLKKGNFVKAKTEDGTWQYFEIYNVKKTMTSYAITGRHIAFMANKNFIENSYTDYGNGQKIMTNLQNSLAFKQPFKFTSNVGTLHQFTAKQVKPIDALIGQNNGNQNLVGVTAAELDFDNYEIKLVKQIGADNGYRIDFGVNLEAIEETIDEDYYNSLYLIGGVPENDYDENKEPITYKFLEVKGVTDKNRRIDKRENSNCKTVEELKKWGQTLFDNDRIHEPKATHTVSMVNLEHTLEYGELYQKIASLHFGDVAHVYVKQLEIDLQERMVEYTWFPTLGKYKSIVLGNDLSMYTSQVKTETQELRQKIDNRTESMVQNVLNATAWITGNSGGHVIFRPEKAPEEILIMDKPDVATAKRVWRWNLNGLGYSDNGVNGPFGIAMTSKGEIVANYIKVGTISADVFESSFNNYGDVLQLVKGTLQIWNKNTKIMELTKQGLEFWNGNSHVGTMGTKGNPFPDLTGMDGPVVTDGNAILLVADSPKQIIGLSNQTGKGIVINGEQQLFLGNRFSFSAGEVGKESTTILQNVEIHGKLIVNGKEITGNGSGGGNDNGNPPAELTTDQEKNAWFVWQYFKGKGWKIEAIAGMLGNMQSESGIMPDIDELSGGGGYGLVQWTPKSKLVDWCNERGLDHRKIDSQCQRIQWEVENNVQWFPNAERPDLPNISFKEFTQLTDIKRAAEYFIAYYEHPAEVNQPIRGTQAQYWYDKLKDLKPGNSTGAQGLAHLETLYKQRLGNGQCYAVPAEYSGFLGGCGLGAGTNYPLSHVIGNTEAAADIGSSYDWAAVGWKVINNPSFKDLVTGAIINWRRGGNIGDFAVDGTYGHTGVIRGLTANGFQTYEQNIGLGQVVGKYERTWVGSSEVSSIVIPPK